LLASRKIADDFRAAEDPDEYPVAMISFAFDRAAISAARSTARSDVCDPSVPTTNV
jgi:hypothetical protein